MTPGESEMQKAATVGLLKTVPVSQAVKPTKCILTSKSDVS